MDECDNCGGPFDQRGALVRRRENADEVYFICRQCVDEYRRRHPHNGLFDTCCECGCTPGVTRDTGEADETIRCCQLQN